MCVWILSGPPIFWLCLHWSVHLWNDHQGAWLKQTFEFTLTYSKRVDPCAHSKCSLHASVWACVCPLDDRPGSHPARRLLFPRHVEHPRLHRGGGSSDCLRSNVSQYISLSADDYAADAADSLQQISEHTALLLETLPSKQLFAQLQSGVW